MKQKWAFTEESEPVPAAAVTLVEGASFVICDAAGDVNPGGVQGLFVADTRVCNRLRLFIDELGVEALTVATRSPSVASFVGRTRDRGLLVFRDLAVTQGLRFDLRVRNLSREPRVVAVRLTVGSDLADLFAVKEGRATSPAMRPSASASELRFVDDGERRGLLVTGGDGATAGADGTLDWLAHLGPAEEWETTVELAAVRGGDVVPLMLPDATARHPSVPASSDKPQPLGAVDSDVRGLSRAIVQSRHDLGGLRLLDPDHPGEALIAAGAPWFMTLFGRDSILTSWMTLLLDPGIALATVRALARLQGRDDVPATEEQPGRILHEVRFSRSTSLALADGDAYYGSADATPLFVMLVHELWRWGVPLDDLDDVLPAVDRALEWIAGPGDPDGDGYIECVPRVPGSLVNQGWKDSFDGVSYADGRVPEPPVSLAEVQAYAYAAWRAGAALAAARGDHVTAAKRDANAEVLRSRFDTDFWLPERNALALALDRDKQPVDAVASNMGHCLWTGVIADNEKAEAIARWLTSREMFTGWGVRTLATPMGRYNPISYHNGSVWPHDTAICVAGLRRAGFADEAVEVGGALLHAADTLGGRLPELFAGLTSAEMPVPVPYPASCAPQAWASAAPFLVLRALLGLEPDVPGGQLRLDPQLPAGALHLSLTDIPLNGHQVSIEVDGDAIAVRGLPRELTLTRVARQGPGRH